MYLSDKLNNVPRKVHDHEELEVLLESFAKQVEEIVNEAENIQVSSGHSSSLEFIPNDMLLHNHLAIIGHPSRPDLPVTGILSGSIVDASPTVERAIHSGDRRAHPRRQPECASSARPENLHPDNGDRHRNARRRRIRYERESSNSAAVRVPRSLTPVPDSGWHFLSGGAQQLKSHLEEHEYAFYLMTAGSFAAFLGAAWIATYRCAASFTAPLRRSRCDSV